MIHLARYALITFVIVIGIPYVLLLIGMAKVADRHFQSANLQLWRQRDLE